MKKSATLLVSSLAVLGSMWAISVPAETVAAPVAAPAAFNSCKACHSVEPGKVGSGPSLAGVVGRRAGSEAGFAYSPALRGSGKVWTAEELDTFLANPTGTVPGTRMVLPVRNAAQRRAIIDYLKTI